MRLRKSAEGGLVLDAGGEAIGMAVFGPRRRVLVIPTATIERIAPKLASNGRIARGYLGLGLQPVTIEGGEGSGAMVMRVDPQGPGALAGLYQGDILVAWNGEPIGMCIRCYAHLDPTVSAGRLLSGYAVLATRGKCRSRSPRDLPLERERPFKPNSGGAQRRGYRACRPTRSPSCGRTWPAARKSGRNR